MRTKEFILSKLRSGKTDLPDEDITATVKSRMDKAVKRARSVERARKFMTKKGL